MVIGTGCLEDLLQFDLISKLSNMQNLAGFDIENHILPDINFDYYTPDEFINHQTINTAISKDSFTVFHSSNVRSLNANYNNLISLLSDLNHSFSIIGISETKIVVNNEPIANTHIPILINI